jgi:uncharacterized protein with ATP-grasp and redox domains
MTTNIECIPCIINSLLRLLKLESYSDEIKESAIRKLLSFLSEVSYNEPPPILSKKIHQILSQELNTEDPYKRLKKKYNDLLLELYPQLLQTINNAEHPVNMAMRLAVAGNVIDFGPQFQMDIMKTIDKVVYSEFAYDDSRLLHEDLKSAKSLLYVGDNCGEIVMDKLFLSFIDVPQIVYAVRHSPVINDATIEDAEYVGIDKYAKIISMGDNTPGAVWNSTSEEFKNVFRNADVVISKGQGNLEGLIDVDQNIYFLLVTKCELIGNLIETKKGDFVIKRSSFMKNKTLMKKEAVIIK